MNLKELGRFRQKTIKQRTQLKIQLTSYVDQTFPELQYFFKSGLHQKSVYALLKEAPTAQALKLFLVFLLQSPVFFIVSPAYLEELLTFLVSP